MSATLSRLEEIAEQLAQLESERRTLAVQGVSEGLQKLLVARAARISRPTLDAWLLPPTTSR